MPRVCTSVLFISMGLKVVPQLEDYWSTTNILGCPDIVKSFSRNRFQALLSTIHLNDNSQALPRDNPAFDKIEVLVINAHIL